MKRIFVLQVFVLIFGVALLSSCETSNSDAESGAESYLEQRYGTNFKLFEPTTGADDNTLFSCNASPIDNPDLIFTVSQVYSKANVIPFLPSMKHKVFTDNFIDAIKSTILKNESMDTISVQNDFDIDLMAQNIYNVMETINTMLEEYNIEATKYSCNVTITFTNGEKEKDIDFWELELNTIKTLIQTAIRS